jgi:ABC-type glycerol-3-phosphate transport system substrate-binding protein
MRRLVAAVTVALVTALTLGACGGSSSSSGAGSNEPTKVIDITFDGSNVTPNGTDIDVKVGQRIEFDVTADKPGEIHVHSSPAEQEFEYKTGSSAFQVKPIPAPTQVVVESHTLDKTLFTLVAR